MKRTVAFPLGLALLGLGLAAQAQTTPAAPPRPRPAHGLPRAKAPAFPTGTAAGHPRIDTAAFRRSGRPADAVPIRPRPELPIK